MTGAVLPGYIGYDVPRSLGDDVPAWVDPQARVWLVFLAEEIAEQQAGRLASGWGFTGWPPLGHGRDPAGGLPAGC